MANVTNDSWFGNYGEPYLHLALTIFRSIEVRIPMLRSTNTGFTTYIDATGEIAKTTQLNTTDVLQVDVPKHPNLVSPMVAVAPYLGPDWFAHFCEMLAVLLTLYTCLKFRQSK